MKRILNFITIVATLTGLTDCSEDSTQIASYYPRFSVEYVDSEGDNILRKFIGDTELTEIEKTVEVLSLTDQDSNPVKFSVVFELEREHKEHKRPVINFNIDEPFTFASPKMEKEYTVKYKIPFVFGKDRIEEIKLIFRTTGVGEGGFTEVWYNGDKTANLIFTEDFYANTNNESEIEKKREELQNKIYNGGNTAVFEGSMAFIVIPVN